MFADFIYGLRQTVAGKCIFLAYRIDVYKFIVVHAKVSISGSPSIKPPPPKKTHIQTHVHIITEIKIANVSRFPQENRVTRSIVLWGKSPLEAADYSFGFTTISLPLMQNKPKFKGRQRQDETSSLLYLIYQSVDIDLSEIQVPACQSQWRIIRLMNQINFRQTPQGSPVCSTGNNYLIT